MESMSQSDAATKLPALVRSLHNEIDQTIQNGELSRVAVEDVTSLATSAVRLYAAVAEELEREIPVTDSTISTTEAMVVACALLRSQNLNPFDLALWFSRTAPRARNSEAGA